MSKFDDNVSMSLSEAYLKMIAAQAEQIVEKKEEEEVSKKDVEEVEKDLEKVVDKIEEKKCSDVEDADDSSVMKEGVAPRKGTVAYNAEQQRKKQDSSPDRVKEIERVGDKNHMVGKARVVKDSPVKEGTDRSEFTAHKDLELAGARKGGDRMKGKFYLMRGLDQVHPDAHDTPDSALKAWKTLDDTKGVRIVKEDVDGPVDVVAEDVMESFAAMLKGDSVQVVESEEAVEEQAIDKNFTGLFNGVASEYRRDGRQWNTVAFRTVDDANKFMGSDEGVNHGFIGQCENGLYHCAHNDDEGKSE